jgi:ribonuclease E
MLEIERENSESANGRDGTNEQDGGQGRGLLRRARRAVTRPAGPPAAAPLPAPAQSAARSPAGDAPGNAPVPSSTVPSSTVPSNTVASHAGAGDTVPPDTGPKDRPADTGPADTAGDRPPARGRAKRQSSRAEGTGGDQPQSSAEPQPDAGPKADQAEAQPATAGRTSRSRSTRSKSAKPAGPAGGDDDAQAAGTGTADKAEPDRSSVPPAAFQPPLVIFQPPEITASRPTARPAREADEEPEAADGKDEEGSASASKRRRRGGRGRGRGQGGAADATEAEAPEGTEPAAEDAEDEERDAESGPSGKRRRRRRRGGAGGDADGQGADGSSDDPPNTVVHVRPPRAVADSDVRAVKGSTRLEAKRQRRREGRESGRRRPPIITESEFLARREAVERVMVVRQHADRTQIAVLEDGVLVEHYVDKASHQSYVGNVYLGKVQNVLPSMEAAFVDIGKGRNAVLYAGEVNFDASGLEGESKRIESALKSGQSILVQVTKDPIGHKGARLTSQVSLPGRYLVYVPGASMTGISRKLPDTERSRLKQILKQVMPENAGVIVRTAAEGASEEELSRDVARLSAQWEAIEKKSKTAIAPDLLYSEPDLTLRVVRDIFNEDFSDLVIASDSEWDLVDEYVRYVAPHLADRLQRWDDDKDVFAAYRIDEQLAKALERKVWLPSGGSLVIDHTEAMTVIDVNTGKFTGQGGNLEQTVTRNNLEAAEEIVRQLRLRDLGGIIVIDFIDMVLESNRELVLRRLLECLARDRTKHQVAEVTSLGLVQMTRKRVGSGLLEAFSVPCEHCNGRGVIISMEPVDHSHGSHGRDGDGHGKDGGRGGKDQASGRSGGRGAKSGQGKDSARKAGDSPAAPAEVGSPAESDGTSGGSKSSRSRSRSGASRSRGAAAASGAAAGSTAAASTESASTESASTESASTESADGEPAGSGPADGGAAAAIGQDADGSAANGSAGTAPSRSRSRRSRQSAPDSQTEHNGRATNQLELGSGEAGPARD